MAGASRAHGAYGFRISGLDESAAYLHPVPVDWPELTLRFTGAVDAPAQDPGRVRIGDRAAELWLAEAGRITMTRNPLAVTFATSPPLSADAALHPFLGLPAAIAGDWLDRPSLHGGAFMHGDRAWLLLGGRGAGKSATLALLLAGGFPILSDDVLILDGADLFAGPRSVDLRQDAAKMIGGEPLGLIGNRERWRLRPPPTAAAVTIGGIIYLEWSDRVAITPIHGVERLTRMLRSTTMPARNAHSETVLEVAALPAVAFARPRRLHSATDAVAQLLAELPAP